MLYLLIHRETDTRELFSTAYELSIRLWGAHNCDYLAYKGEVPIPLPCSGSADAFEALCEEIPQRMRDDEYARLRARRGPWFVTSPDWRGCIRDHFCYPSGAVEV